MKRRLGPCAAFVLCLWSTPLLAEAEPEGEPEPSPPPPELDFPPPTERDGMRARTGLGLELGGGAGERGHFAGAVSTRAGLQFAPMFGSFFQGRVLLGGAFPNAGIAIGAQLSLLAELALPAPVPGAWQRPWLFALGPSLDVLAVPGCNCPDAGGALGAEARVSMALVRAPVSRIGGGRSNFFLTFAGHPSATFDGQFLLQGWAGLSLETF